MANTKTFRVGFDDKSRLVVQEENLEPSERADLAQQFLDIEDIFDHAFTLAPAPSLDTEVVLGTLTSAKVLFVRVLTTGGAVNLKINNSGSQPVPVSPFFFTFAENGGITNVFLRNTGGTSVKVQVFAGQ